MRLVERTIFKEMTAAFFLGLMVFTFVLLTNRILRLVELIVNKGVGIGTVLQLFLYVLPYSLIVTIPMSVLLATLATFTRMSADGELLALRSAGVGIGRLLRPGLVFGIVATIAAFIISVWVLPFSNQAFRNLIFEMARRQVAVGIQEGIFNNLFDGLVLFVEHLDARTSEMKGVFLVDSRNGNERRVIVARSGKFASDPNEQRLSLSLQNGSVHFSGTEATGRYRLLTFQDYALTLDASRPFADPFQRSLDEQELTLDGLKERAATLRAAGKNYHPPLVQYHKKLALPFACLLFVLVGVPLGSRIRRGGRGLSLALSVAFALGYYLLTVAGEGLGGRGYLPELIAMWLPNVLVALGGCVLLVHAQVHPARLREAFGRRVAVRSA